MLPLIFLLFGVIIATQHPRLSKSFQIRNIRNLAQASLVNASGAFYFTSVGTSDFVYFGSLPSLITFRTYVRWSHAVAALCVTTIMELSMSMSMFCPLYPSVPKMLRSVIL